MTSAILLRRPRESDSQKTGLGRYSDSLEQFLTKEKVDYDVIEVDISLKRGRINAVLNGLVIPFFKVLLKCRKKDTIVHATDELCGYLLPFASGKRIVTVHHVPIFGDNRLWSFLTNTSLKHSEKVVAISSLTKSDLEKFSKLELDIHVINNNISEIYHRDESIKRNLSIGVVAQLSQRKNIKASIDAFDILIKKPNMGDYSMYICGTGDLFDDLQQYVKDKGLQQNIQFISHLSDEELVSFYNEISLLFNTSMQEGIGMTTLEANRCGTPSLCLKDAKIPEAVLGGSIICDDVKDLANKAFDILTDEEKYHFYSERSLKFSDEFGNDFNNNMCTLYGLKEDRGQQEREGVKE